MKTQKAQKIDKLTGSLKHEVFVSAFEELLQYSDSNQSYFTLAMVDIDHFLQINKELGRGAGDEVLRLVTKHLIKSVGAKGNIYRYGGDEFAVVMPEFEKEEAFLLLERVRSEFDMEHEINIGEKQIICKPHLSIGIASYPEDGKKCPELIRKADDAIFRAKMGGRNKVCLAREERMITKTSHYTQGQLDRLSNLAKKEKVGEAVLLREALDDLIRKFRYLRGNKQ